jgi:hypothetical protein
MRLPDFSYTKWRLSSLLLITRLVGCLERSLQSRSNPGINGLLPTPGMGPPGQLFRLPLDLAPWARKGSGFHSDDGSAYDGAQRRDARRCDGRFAR